MDYIVYSIFDRCGGVYGEPFIAVREEQAVRRFNYLMSNSPMVAKDCDLYKLGRYNSEIGFLSGLDKPEFVCRYEVSVGE